MSGLCYDPRGVDAATGIVANAAGPLPHAKSNSLTVAQPVSAAALTSAKDVADRAVMLLLVAAAIALGNVVRVLLFFAVIIWALAKLPWLCLSILFGLGMRAVDRTLASLRTLSQSAAASWNHNDTPASAARARSGRPEYRTAAAFRDR